MNAALQSISKAAIVAADKAAQVGQWREQNQMLAWHHAAAYLDLQAGSKNASAVAYQIRCFHRCMVAGW
jgi:hypothetical protein